MKKFIIALSALAALTYNTQSMAALNHYMDSKNKAIHKGHEAQESRLRECLAYCVPSTCRENRNYAQECAELCKGHDTSLANWLYKKCSAAAGLGRASETYGVSEYDSNRNSAQVHAARQASQHQTAQMNHQATYSEHSNYLAQAPHEAHAYNQGQTWSGAPDATLRERTLVEAIPTENLYGLSETDMQLYGLNSEGHPMSHGMSNPEEYRGYGHSANYGYYPHSGISG